MKTKLGASLIAALMMMGLFGVSQATAEPGPNGNNDKGLCTAYFNGQKKGHDKDGDGQTDNARAFQGLEAAAGVTDEIGDEVATMVRNWCADAGVVLGGNPDDNGRWTCTEGDDGYTCESNSTDDSAATGNSKPA